MTEICTKILGNTSDQAFTEQLHRLGHNGHVEYLVVSEADLPRKRLRGTTDRGTECVIALPRDSSLTHGAILLLSAARAIIVELEALPWMRLIPVNAAAALQLGFLAGHHHWRVRLDKKYLDVALDQPKANYLARIESLLSSGMVSIDD